MLVIEAPSIVRMGMMKIWKALETSRVGGVRTIHAKSWVDCELRLGTVDELQDYADAIIKMYTRFDDNLCQRINQLRRPRNRFRAHPAKLQFSIFSVAQKRRLQSDLTVIKARRNKILVCCIFVQRLFLWTFWFVLKNIWIFIPNPVLHELFFFKFNCISIKK